MEMQTLVEATQGREEIIAWVSALGTGEDEQVCCRRGLPRSAAGSVPVSSRGVVAVLLAATSGYLLGSVSFSRLIGRWRAPGADVSTTEVYVKEVDATVTFHGTTPTSIREHLGGGWAGLAVALEASKALVPAVLARRLVPDTPAAEVAAVAAVVGHVYPLGRSSREGGYGESPILGGLLVLDPLGFVVTNAVAGSVIGVTRDRRFIMAWPLTLPVWAAVRHDRRMLVYAVAVNAVMWSRLVPELRSSLAPVLMRRSGPGAAAPPPPPH